MTANMRSILWLALISTTLIVGCGEDAERGDTGMASSDAGETVPDGTTRDSLPVVPGLDTDVFTQTLSPIMNKVDADQDVGWDTEVFSAEASEQLGKLASALKSNVWDDAFFKLFSDPVTLGEMRPSSWRTVLDDGLLTVRRGDLLPGKMADREVLKASFQALMTPFPQPEDRHVKFKVFRVQPESSSVVVSVYYHASGGGDNGVTEQTATWECRFSRESPPRLQSITVHGFEEITPKDGGLRFAESTKEILGSTASYRGQLSLGIDHWRSRLQGDFGVDVNGLQGLAIGDADGDGLEDLYVCQQGGLPNRLYLRQDDGTLSDYSAESGTDWMELTRAALFVDLDNDGDQDLVLAQGWYLMFMENDGRAHFTKRVEQRAEGQLHSLAAADYDNDGDLDVFFCGRNPAREQSEAEGILGMPLPYHDANNGGPNVLMRNEGALVFHDATVEAGLDVNNRRYSYACSWEDFDNDGDQDLYVANDFGRNNFYRNDNGKFVDVAESLGVEDISAGMSVTWGDVDRDGLMDVYVSNMFSSAGNRIAYQRQFRDGQGAGSLASFQRHARGNTLFLNDKTGFRDVSEATGVTLGRWAWGSKFADLNNDGWEDLYVANGFVTTDDTGDL